MFIVLWEHTLTFRTQNFLPKRERTFVETELHKGVDARGTETAKQKLTHILDESAIAHFYMKRHSGKQMDV